MHKTGEITSSQNSLAQLVGQSARAGALKSHRGIYSLCSFHSRYCAYNCYTCSESVAVAFGYETTSRPSTPVGIERTNEYSRTRANALRACLLKVETSLRFLPYQSAVYGFARCRVCRLTYFGEQCAQRRRRCVCSVRCTVQIHIISNKRVGCVMEPRLLLSSDIAQKYMRGSVCSVFCLYRSLVSSLAFRKIRTQKYAQQNEHTQYI